jgi:hypothetical protein
MEVHPPDHPVHTWRDFAIHIVIVTIGLFIALMLEALVEHIHHVHIVHQARENIRRELQDNHDAAQQDLPLIQKSIDSEKANILAIRALRDHTTTHGSVTNSMDFDSPDDAAWQTARETGALAFMPYDEVQRYSGIYLEQTVVVQHAINTAEHDFLALSPLRMGDDAAHLQPQEYTRLLEQNAEVEIQLETLKQLVQQYDDACLAELKR